MNQVLLSLTIYLTNSIVIYAGNRRVILWPWWVRWVMRIFKL